jgi:hypothetical protein
MVVKSLGDLSIAIHEIGKKYDIDGYVRDFRSSLTSEINPKFWDSLDGIRKGADAEDASPIEKIMLLSALITDDELEKVTKINKELGKKYSYEEFMKECDNARQAFLRDRKSYFSMKVAKRHSDQTGNGGFGSYFEVTGMTDIMLADWLDSIMEAVYPNHLDIKYEDIDGKIVKTKIAHRICVVTPEYVEAPLIDRYHGSNAYDQFYLHSVFDIKKRKWVYIPMRLIIDISTEDGSPIDAIDRP